MGPSTWVACPGQLNEKLGGKEVKLYGHGPTVQY